MNKTIWDLKKGDRFKLKDGRICEVIRLTLDGKLLLGRYIDNDRNDFIFEEEIDFNNEEHNTP